MTKVQATISSFWSKGSEKKTKPRTDDGEGVADSTERKRARKENVQSSNSAVLKDGEADGKVHKTEAESIQRDAEAKKVDAEKETTTEERTTAEKAVAVRKLNSESRKGNEGAEDKASGATWKAGQPVPYQFLAAGFEKAESITGRLEITDTLTKMFKKIVDTTPEDLLPAVYICVNKLGAPQEGLEIGVGEGILIKALSHTCGKSVNALKEEFRKVGDLGDLAASMKANQMTVFKPAPLTVRGVFKDFKAIAKSSGRSAMDEKRARIQKLLVASEGAETKYLARAFQGKLRIHIADKSVLAALAESFPRPEETVARVGSDMSASSLLTHAYNQHPVWDTMLDYLLKNRVVDSGILDACKLTTGVPISPMLAKPTKGIDEVVEKFSDQPFTCEYKYDGERAQIHHLADGSIQIYSRNAENQSEKYPDVKLAMKDVLGPDNSNSEYILDAEVVAINPRTNQILPFQSLQTRARRDVSVAEVKVAVCIFAFDLLYFDKPLIHDPLKQRREKLRACFKQKEPHFAFAKGRDMNDPSEIADYLNESVKGGCEGLMVKQLLGPAATYEPANRSQNWLKVKKDYLEGLTDSLDLVPIAGYYGKGKRTGVFGAFLLACYNPESEQYETTCKIGTGFSEEQLTEFSEFYNEKDRIIGGRKSYYVFSGSTSLEPDVWFEESQVWEIRCADLTISPAHTAAIGSVDPEKGIGLRFPRFLRIRPDREPQNASTSEQIMEMYAAQS
mmetsp:Transcript_41747/g.163808  ORF Transcript_41747/g.163808 Transcript_41747/m.163808 type:complete len:734 (-) Transcript_41747:733-2934(-)|eukprot:CAMPEP_0113962196 /NCGR_PEP_ID=MMETSP0011_2-20120614/5770_1 /TAXON_ID=101924 /ORGANISM="Rhodosorus marinus" /LENGTH=733 /DNA_ID=CAMNT_0000974001 /DNA_START=340 /DNA_END=2541 /DNA_ORIENTATION=+ /assembly_acc=CAM_ASM_000156